MFRPNQKLTDKDCEEIIRSIRVGVQLKTLAEQYGVDPSIISRRCKDQLRSQKVPPDKRNRIFKAIRNGCTKAEAAHKYGLTIGTVDILTKKVQGYPRQGNHIIRPAGIALLNRLLVDGCLITNYDEHTAKTIKKHFPAILDAQYKGKRFYYLKGREEEAIEAFFKQRDSCLISYQTIEEIAYLLGVTTTRKRNSSMIQRHAKKKNQLTTSERLRQPFIDDMCLDIWDTPFNHRRRR